MATDTPRPKTLRPGPVIPAATISLHTRIAVDLFHGRRGFTWFAANLNKLWGLSLQDDPYADYRLILIEEQLPLIRQYLSEKAEDVDVKLGALADAGIETLSHQSVRPVVVPVAFRATQAAVAVLLLATLDQLTQKALMARHFGLMTGADWDGCVGTSAAAVRDLFALSEQRASGASRDDFASKNARAREAVERLGTIPDEIVEGTRRPTMGPRH